MSGLLSEPLRSDEQEFATLRHGDSAKTQRQRPNRPSDGFGSGKSVTMDDDGETLPEVEISAGQKMLSAVSGSLLTSLLGQYFSFLVIFSMLLTH